MNEQKQTYDKKSLRDTIIQHGWFIRGTATIIVAAIGLYFAWLSIPLENRPFTQPTQVPPTQRITATSITISLTDSPVPVETSATLMATPNENISKILTEAIPSLREENGTLQEIATAHAQYLSTQSNSSVDDIEELITFQSGDNLRGELRRAGYDGFDTAELLVFIGDEVTAELITTIAQAWNINLQSGFVSYGYASIRSRLNQRDNTVLILGKIP